MVARVAETDRFFENCGGPPVSATALKERLRLILEVRPGERALLPSFGCRVHELPAIETEHERRLAEVLIEEALHDWAPWAGVRRVLLLSVEEERISLRLTGRLPGLEISFQRSAERDTVEGR
jgi:phage baseplate assembly protein W